MILKVSRLGHPVLRAGTRDLTPEEIRAPEMKRLLADMVDTMREYAGVGLAAPQVHLPLRMAVIEVRGNPRYPQAPDIPVHVLFNIRLTPIGEATIDDHEGCLSVPDLRGRVRRWAKVGVEALDAEANPVRFEAEGFYARILQHETDHLDGAVYVDRVDTRTLSFLAEFQRFHLPGVKLPEE